MKNLKKHVSAIIISLLTLAVSSARANFVYDGHLMNSAGVVLANTTVTLKLAILNPSADCVVYREFFPVTSGADGYFSVVAGTGSTSGIAIASNTLNQVVANIPLAISGFIPGTATACSYTPSLFDSRKMSVAVSSDGTNFDLLGAMDLQPAVQALNSSALGGANVAQFFRGGSGVNLPEMTAAQATELQNLYSGTSSTYLKSSSVSGQSISASTGDIMLSATSGTVNLNSYSPMVLGSSSNISLNTGASSSVNVTSTLASTNANTGALRVAGGLGVAGDVFSNSSINALYLNATGSVNSSNFYGGSTANGNVTIDSTSNGTKGSVFIAPNGGYVGIGTTPPSPPPGAALDVQNGFITTTRFGSTGALLLQSAAGTQALPTATTSSQQVGYIAANGFDGSTYRSVAAIKAFTDPTMTTSTSSPGSITISTTSSGSVTPTERLRITSSGYVGIGAISPLSLLQTADTGSKTNNYTGVLHNVFNTSTTASVNKIGMDIESTGTWSGTSSGNTGLLVNTSGASSNTGLSVNASGTATLNTGMSIFVSGSSVQNTGLNVSVSGGSTNYAATFTGGAVGVGTTNPSATLEVSGHLAVTNTTAPAVSSCGTSPTILTGSSDTRGTVTMGTGSPTSCTVTFNSTFNSAPICVVSWSTTVQTVSIAVSAITTNYFTIATNTAPSSGKFNYICLQ